MKEILELSDYEFAKWNIIPAEDKKIAAKMVLKLSCDAIEKHLLELEDKKKTSDEFVFENENSTDYIGNIDLEAKLSIRGLLFFFLSGNKILLEKDLFFNY